MDTFIVSARLTPEGTVQSCCVILGSITQSKYYYGALREAFLPTLQVLFLPEPPLSLQGSPSGSSLLARLSWTHLEPTQLRLWQAALFVFIQREVQWSGL